MSLERRKLFVILTLLFLYLFFITVQRYDVHVYDRYPFKKVPPGEITSAKAGTWRNIVELLDGHAPGVKPPERLGAAELIGFQDHYEAGRPHLLKMPEEDVKKMRKIHEDFVKNASSHKPLLAYKAGTDGIVTTAGGKYLPVAVISIRMLRRTGSKLPVEVVLTSNKEYEQHVCEVILPSLNARCIVLENYFQLTRPKNEISKYQIKIFAMILSSFENLIFLDADCFPVADPQALLHAEPYTSKGIITWPDFWISTASDYYYEIAAQDPPAHFTRASSESGEILVSKKTHAVALVLATYYNYYGPDFYYPLLSQGGLGEGDKETFLSATLALGLPFYAVTSPVRALGNLNKEGKFQGSAMVQYDPRDDYRIMSNPAETPITQDRNQPRRAAAFFVHANFPKWNPETLFAEWNSPLVGPEGKRSKAWTNQQGVDDEVEKGLWEEMEATACEQAGKFATWTDNGGNCELVKSFREELYGATGTNATKAGG